MTWTIVFSLWAVVLVLFLIANKRWSDRMAQMDADMDAAYGTEEVEYAHAAHPDGDLFRQYAKDPLPAWAVDVRPVKR